MSLALVNRLVAENVIEQFHLAPVPDFTGEIGTAFLAVDKLRAEGYQFELSDLCGDWVASFDADLVAGGQKGEAEGCPAAPLAISLAALAVRGIIITPAEAAAPDPPAGEDIPMRVILSVEPEGRGWIVKFDECGHEVWSAVEVSPGQQMYCSPCVDEALRRMRAAKLAAQEA